MIDESTFVITSSRPICFGKTSVVGPPLLRLKVGLWVWPLRNADRLSVFSTPAGRSLPQPRHLSLFFLSKIIIYDVSVVLNTESMSFPTTCCLCGVRRHQTHSRCCVLQHTDCVSIRMAVIVVNHGRIHPPPDKKSRWNEFALHTRRSSNE